MFGLLMLVGTLSSVYNGGKWYVLAFINSFLLLASNFSGGEVGEEVGEESLGKIIALLIVAILIIINLVSIKVSMSRFKQKDQS